MFPKTLIVSDLHLTSNFDKRKFLFLKKLFSRFDRIIINGDLWCLYHDTFDQFINSGWRHLFPLLKSKNTIYLHGNHDPKKFADNRVFTFCDQYRASYVLKDPPYTFRIQHGLKLLKQKYPQNPLYYKIYRLIKLQPLLYFAQSLVFWLFGYRSIKVLSQKDNATLRRAAHKLHPGEYLVCGHTHLPEFDQQNKFINTGFIGEGVASYLAIWGDSFDFVQTKY